MEVLQGKIEDAENELSQMKGNGVSYDKVFELETFKAFKDAFLDETYFYMMRH